MITWVNFLHLYQPPTQTKEVVDQIAAESYTLFPRLFRDYPNLRLTVNFSGSLLELLQTYGYQSLIEEYKNLAVAGRIELVGSAMYHPILALLPEEEIRRQIALHTEISERVFGSAYHPNGFYIPEMAYSKKVADAVAALGFKWTILDERHLAGGTPPDTSVRYRIAENGLGVLFRSRSISKTFPPEYIAAHKNELDGKTVITANDGEMYGHWHKNDYGYYGRAFTDPEVRMLTVSEYLDTVHQEKIASLREASWESLEEEISANNPFILWNASDNAIHKNLWEFTLFVIAVVSAHRDDALYGAARRHTDRGLASCAWWWATRTKLIAATPVCWNPTEIEKGTRELISAIRSIESLPLETRLKAEASYAHLIWLIWETHWKTNVAPNA